MLYLSRQRQLGYEALPEVNHVADPSERLQRMYSRWVFAAGMAIVGVTGVMWSSLPSRTILIEQEEHLQPTLLSLVHPTSNRYLNAFENPMYEHFRGASFAPPTSETNVELSLDYDEIQPHDPLTLAWSSSHELKDDDTIALYCGPEIDEKDHHGRNFLEVATLAQIRATSLQHGGSSEHWYIPSFPALRHDLCEFVLYKKLSHRQYRVISNVILHMVDTPTSIHLALGVDPSAMTISFITGGEGTPVAMYGKTSPSEKIEGTSSTYTAEDMCQEPANITEAGKFQSPGSLHTIRLTELEPDTLYHYKVGLAAGQGIVWSPEYTFTTAPVVGDSRPFSYLAYADQGCPSNGWNSGADIVADMVDREIDNDDDGKLPIKAVHHIGDLSYSMGAAHIWDEWQQMITPFTTNVPLMVAVGNHEYGHTAGGGNGKDPSHLQDPRGYSPSWGNYKNDSGGECGVPYAKRFTMPESPGSNGNFWYSYDYASVHTVVISSEHDLSKGSIQHEWLENDLKSVDRSLTPWVVVEVHRPLYEGEQLWADNAVGVALRFEVEDVLKDYQVDVVLSGHYHAYHRTCDGLYRNKCNHGGPIHITNGAAGAQLNEVDLFQNDWSAKYIKGFFGYGRITVQNATHMRYEFVHAVSEDDTDAGEVLDDFWIVRNR